ncbi:MAG: helix-turn-helix transcriptional regulator [Planctomycetota bacterium]|nr:helix-turn-helix transcriptional regulator [Planctomycetota bacterium]
MPTKTVPSRLTQQSQEPIVFGSTEARTQAFRRYTHKVATDVHRIEQYIADANQSTVWISVTEKFLYGLVEHLLCATSPIGKLIALHPIRQQSWPTLEAVFKHIAPLAAAPNRLPKEELFEVLVADNRDDLFIGGNVDHATKIITLWRGNLKPLNVPFSSFKCSGNGIRPDYCGFGIKDYGQTIRLGKYEAAADALLYEFDPEYRRRAKKNRIASEKSFGAALRRLRILRGFKRDDFAQLSPKTIARIERGETKKDAITPRTLKAIAHRLSVTPEKIEGY